MKHLSVSASVLLIQIQIDWPDHTKPFPQAGLEAILDPNADIGDEDIISAKDLYMNFKRMLRKNDGSDNTEAL